MLDAVALADVDQVVAAGAVDVGVGFADELEIFCCRRKNP